MDIKYEPQEEKLIMYPHRECPDNGKPRFTEKEWREKDEHGKEKINSESTKAYLNINAAILNSTIFSLVPLAIIFTTPNVWWGFIIKASCGLWLLGALQDLFYHPLWSRVIGFGAGITLNMLWFSLIWFLQPHWSIFFFILFMLADFFTMKKILKEHYYDEKKP